MIIDKEKLNEILHKITNLLSEYELLPIEATCVLEIVKAFYADIRERL